MAGRWNGHRDWLRLNADINVTSLVDVAFTLLVIFIITAPIMQGGIEVNLPEARSAAVTASDPVIVTVAEDGTIYVGQAAVPSTDEFETVFREYVEEHDKREAFLKGDRGVAYGRVLQVLGMMKALDITTVSLVAQPETDR